MGVPLPDGLQHGTARLRSQTWLSRYAQPDSKAPAKTVGPPSLSPPLTLAAILSTSYPVLERIAH